MDRGTLSQVSPVAHKQPISVASIAGKCQSLFDHELVTDPLADIEEFFYALLGRESADTRMGLGVGGIVRRGLVIENEHDALGVPHLRDPELLKASNRDNRRGRNRHQPIRGDPHDVTRDNGVFS
jgi:hypothetical protein